MYFFEQHSIYRLTVTLLSYSNINMYRPKTLFIKRSTFCEVYQFIEFLNFGLEHHKHINSLVYRRKNPHMKNKIAGGQKYNSEQFGIKIFHKTVQPIF